uniref:Tr-type G domain-containing protein n=1 Tax=Panagrolaimus sp. ES5 TaxID=591445 RepID=A0AC34GYB9_9BILA
MDFMLTDFTEESQAPIFSSSFSKDTATLLSRKTIKGDESLPPENDNGNIEYKAKLCSLSKERIHHLTTQMKWRLREGQGECVYEIGVEDDGSLTGIIQSEMDESLKCLHQIADSISANFSVLSEREITEEFGDEKRFVTEVLIRKVPDNLAFIQIRLAILGSVESGKSTICGVLSKGQLDNGQGSARLNLFRYLHEFQTGKTSSICLGVIGFNSDGQLLNCHKNSLDEVVEESTKLMTLIDLCGDRKYIRTTTYGLCGYNPHYCALCISATTGPTADTREHAALAMVLNISIFVLITKADCVSEQQIMNVIARTNKLLKTIGLTSSTEIVDTLDQAISSAASLQSKDSIPIFIISAVTGQNLDYLKCFLNILPTSFTPIERNALSQKSPFFQVEDVFRVPRVGIVVAGLLNEGILYVGDRVKIGPNRVGTYQEGRVCSIKRNKQSIFSIHPGEAASIAIKFNDEHVVIHRGMVMIPQNEPATSCWEFEAKFLLFYHPGNEIEKNFQGTVYIGFLCRTATIVSIDSPTKTIKPLTWTTVKFKFYAKPEHVQVGASLIFREQKTRGMAEVTKIC